MRKAEIEYIEFAPEDVITTSVGGGPAPPGDDFWP